jgi:hypothetical protein
MKKKILVIRRPRPPEQRDASKLGKIYGKLNRLSVNTRRAEVMEVLKPSLPRTKVVLNVKGNLRGMGNANNSEHMRKVRAMRQFYNKKMPVLSCSVCAYASTCPQFKAGYECAYLPFLKSHTIETERDLLEAAKELCSANMQRMHLATLAETLSGAAPSLETTEALTMVFQQLMKLHEVTSKSDEASLSIETDDGNVIERIFGGFSDLLMTTRHAQANPIEVVPEQARLSNNPLDADAILVDKTEGDVNYKLLREHARDELDGILGEKKEAIPVVTVSELKAK